MGRQKQQEGFNIKGNEAIGTFGGLKCLPLVWLCSGGQMTVKMYVYDLSHRHSLDLMKTSLWKCRDMYHTSYMCDQCPLLRPGVVRAVYCTPHIL